LTNTNMMIRSVDVLVSYNKKTRMFLLRSQPKIAKMVANRFSMGLTPYICKETLDSPGVRDCVLVASTNLARFNQTKLTCKETNM
jgi:intracellular sulfur oxidation DsrE/DsrF family protein